MSTSISILTRWPAAAVRALEHRPDAAGDRDVVVLDQDRIIEPEAVIEAAAAAHRVFLQRAQSRRGLARAADARAGCRDAAHEFVRGASRRRRDGREDSAPPARPQARRGRSPRRSSASVLAATLAPSRTCAAISTSGASLRKVAATSGRPEMMPALRATTFGARRRVLRDGRDRGDVAGAAEILGERARHRRRRSRAAREKHRGREGSSPSRVSTMQPMGVQAGGRAVARQRQAAWLRARGS